MLRLRFLKTKHVCLTGVLVILVGGSGFSFYWNKQQALIWSGQCLYQAFDTGGDAKLKHWEFNVTPESFVRLRKTYQNGKQEYFSFNIKRFNDIDYFGNTTRGFLCFKTQADDIIVQTHNDRKGNIDSMATMLKIPVKNMNAERLDSLLTAFHYLRQH